MFALVSFLRQRVTHFWPSFSSTMSVNHRPSRRFHAIANTRPSFRSRYVSEWSLDERCSNCRRMATSGMAPKAALTTENTIMHPPIHPQVPCAYRFTTGPFAGFRSREVFIIAREVAS